MLKVCVLLAVLFNVDGTLIYASPGQDVTLPCVFDSTVTKLSWYKQVPGAQPQVIVNYYRSLTNSNKFHHPFQNDKRFSIHTGEGFYHLNISNVQELDSAMYYCADMSITHLEFHKGVFLLLKESSRRSFIVQPASELVQPGSSVTLNCSVTTGICDDKHTVYWFKKESSGSPLGVMYIPSKSSRECGKKVESDAPELGCVYHFIKDNVSVSDAGMYHCAVAHCGDVLFGKGTRLNVEGKREDTFSVVFFCVAAALLLSTILNIIVICMLCKVSGTLLRSRGLHAHSDVHNDAADSQGTDVDDKQYVALDFKRSKSKRRQRTEEGTVYSEVRLKK